MRERLVFILAIGILLCLGACARSAAPDDQADAQTSAVFDVVLTGGTVIDPETGLNAVRNVGILDDKIAEVSDQSLRGARTIDVSGYVVAPGFIDLHAHGQHLTAQRLQVQDGVTTALEMEGGAYPIADFLERRAGQSLINYGASASHICIRVRIKYDMVCADVIDEVDRTGSNQPIMLRSPPTAFTEPLNEDELGTMRDHLANEIKGGAVGLGLGIEYVPAAGRKEIYETFKLAAEFGLPVFVHVRGRAPDPAPGVPIAVVQEVIANASVTGAPLQLVHVTSTALDDAPVVIDMIERAQTQSLDITTEVYPYTAASTNIGSAVFAGDWQSVCGVGYDNLTWAKTGERLTEETFQEYRRSDPLGNVVMHLMDEETVRYALSHPIVSIASDGMPWVTSGEHPRGSGTFARVLGKYVRDEGVLSLEAAIEKMTLMPARRMERIAPAFLNKGRVQAGADADITIFNPDTVIDQATFASPMQPSEGIEYVFVGGVEVVSSGEIVEGVFPGRPVKGRWLEVAP